MKITSLLLFAPLLLMPAMMLGCSQDPPKKTMDQESVPIASGPSRDEEEPGNESGNEGDEESLPPIVPVPVQGSGSAALNAEVSRMLSRVAETHYSHHTNVDEQSATYDVDCSGLVDYGLAHVLPDAFEAVRAATVKRPLAKHYVAFLSSFEPGAKRGRWRRLGRADELIPGDVIAWLKPAESTSHNTGHMMIARGTPTREGNEIAVPIYDSTGQRHGADDSRFASKATGIGTGTIYLLVNSAGAPIGYRWSHGRHARTHGTVVTLGRVE